MLASLHRRARDVFGRRHVDGFEGWLEAGGLIAHHLFTVLVKIVGVLRQVAIDSPDVRISSDLRDRLRYISAKPFQRSRPRDAYSPFVARQFRDAARMMSTASSAVCSRVPSMARSGHLQGHGRPSRRLSSNMAASGTISPRTGTLYFVTGAARIADASTADRRSQRLVTTSLRPTISPPFLALLSLGDGPGDRVLQGADGRLPSERVERNSRDHLSQAPRPGRRAQALRVRDGGVDTPGGLIRRLIEVTASARKHHPSDKPLGLSAPGRLRPPASATRRNSSMCGPGDTRSSMMMGVRSGSSRPACARPTRRFGT